MTTEFKVIETQEELEKVLKSRLEREQKKYEGFTSPADVQALKDSHLEEIKALKSEISELSKKPTELQSKIDELTKQNTAYEIDSVKTKVASDLGLSIDSKQFLTGSNEEEIKASALKFKEILDKNTKHIPLASTETKKGDSTENAYRGMLEKMVKQ